MGVSDRKQMIAAQTCTTVNVINLHAHHNEVYIQYLKTYTTAASFEGGFSTLASRGSLV